MSHEFTPSHFQQGIFNFIQDGKGNLIVQAVAGSGKTTTILKAIRLIPSNKSILYLAFNREIVSQIKEKHNDIRNVEFKTLHGYGMSVLVNDNNSIIIDNYKYSKMLRNIVGYLSGNTKSSISEYDFTQEQKNILKKFLIQDDLDEDDSSTQFMNRITDLCNWGRMMLANTIEEMEAIASKHDIDTFHNEHELALMLMELGTHYRSAVDFTDMIYLPIVLDLPLKKHDWVFVDECQDLNIAQRTLMLGAVKTDTGRFVAVGDPCQAIYGFAGADIISFENFKKVPNTIELPLSVCYRCGKDIVDFAKKLVPQIESFEKNGKGIVNFESSKEEIQDGDMVLCRVTYPLVKMCFDYIKKGVKAHIRGRDVGKNLTEMIVKTKKLSLEDMFGKLYYNLEKFKQRLMREHKITLKEAEAHDKYKNEVEKIQIIELLGSESKDSQEIIQKIELIFSDTDKSGIQLSTVHKAKGLESNNVFIIHPNLMPSKWARKEWEIVQENNIMYVAYTRAKHYLGFVTDFDAYSGQEELSKSKSVKLVADSNHIGVPGEEINTNLKMISEEEINTKNGKVLLYKFIDESENIFSQFGWVPEIFLKEENKDKFLPVQFFIRDHTNFRGSKENSITKLKCAEQVRRVKENKKIKDAKEAERLIKEVEAKIKAAGKAKNKKKKNNKSKKAASKVVDKPIEKPSVHKTFNEQTIIKFD